MSPCIRLYGTTRDGRLAPSTLSEVVASFTGRVGQMEMRRKRFWFIKRPAGDIILMSCGDRISRKSLLLKFLRYIEKAIADEYVIQIAVAVSQRILELIASAFAV